MPKNYLTGIIMFKTTVALEVNPIIVEKSTKMDDNLIRKSCVVRLRAAKKGVDNKFDFKNSIRFNLGWTDLINFHFGLVNKKETNFYHETSKAGGQEGVVKSMKLVFAEKYTGIIFDRKDTKQQIFFPLTLPEISALSLIMAKAIELNVFNSPAK